MSVLRSLSSHPAICLSAWLIVGLGLSACASTTGQLSNAYQSRTLWPELANLPSGNAPCALLQPSSSGQTAGGMRALEVKGEGACQLGGEGGLLLLSTKPSQPRLLGYAPLLVVHAGDTLVLPETIAGESKKAVDGQALEPVVASLAQVDTAFSKPRGSVPAGSQPLSMLSSLSNGMLTASGTFDHQDQRPADGAETIRALLKADKVGSISLKVSQDYQLEGAQDGRPNRGTRTASIDIEVVAATTPLTIEWLDLSLSPNDGENQLFTQKLGTGDLLAPQLTLGFLSRMGSESRSPAGISSK